MAAKHQHACPAWEQLGTWRLSRSPRAPSCLGRVFFGCGALAGTQRCSGRSWCPSGFPWCTQGGWRTIIPLPFLGAGWQHLSKDFGKAPSAGSALPLQQTFLFVHYSPSPCHAQLSIPPKDGCGSPWPPQAPSPWLPTPRQNHSLNPWGFWSPSSRFALKCLVQTTWDFGIQTTKVLLNLQPYRNSLIALRGTSSDATDAGKRIALQQMLSLFQPGILLPPKESSAPPVHPSTHQSILSTSVHQFKPVSALGNSFHPFIFMWVLPVSQSSHTGPQPSLGNQKAVLLMQSDLSKQQTQKRGQGPPNFPGWSLMLQNFMP